MLFTSLSSFYPRFFNRNDIILLEYPIENYPTPMLYQHIRYFTLPTNAFAFSQPPQGSYMILTILGQALRVSIHNHQTTLTLQNQHQHQSQVPHEAHQDKRKQDLLMESLKEGTECSKLSEKLSENQSSKIASQLRPIPITLHDQSKDSSLQSERRTKELATLPSFSLSTGDLIQRWTSLLEREVDVWPSAKSKRRAAGRTAYNRM